MQQPFVAPKTRSWAASSASPRSRGRTQIDVALGWRPSCCCALALAVCIGAVLPAGAAAGKPAAEAAAPKLPLRQELETACNQNDQPGSTVLPTDTELAPAAHQHRDKSRVRQAVQTAVLVQAQAPHSTDRMQKPPHLVLALVDDFGWHAPGFRNKDVSSPTLDRLANEEGRVLSRHYVYQFCSPSRCSALSGRLGIHVNELNGPITIPGQGIPRNMSTIADKLRRGGYRTHMVGKWHGGAGSWGNIPAARGFDTSLCFFACCEDHWTNHYVEQSCVNVDGSHFHTDLWQDYGPAYGRNGTVYSGVLFNAEAVKHIRAHNASLPMFLYYGFHDTHAPLEAPDEYIMMYNRTVDNPQRVSYYAMTSFVDAAMHNVVEALSTNADMWSRTLLVLSADNGGPIYQEGGACNYPLKGGKFSDFEGGIRATALVAGGLIPPAVRGKPVEGLISVADWFGTFCTLAGVDATDEVAEQFGLPAVDSIDVWPLVSGRNSTSPRVELPLASNFTQTWGVCPHCVVKPTAPRAPGLNLIVWPYKLLRGFLGREAGWTGPKYPNATQWDSMNATQDCGRGCLYNIQVDPTEHENLAASMPAKLDELLRRSDEISRTVFHPARGKPDPRACKAAVDNGGYWSPWLP